MPTYKNVSGALQRQPDGRDWAPGACHEWPEEAVRSLLLYKRVRLVRQPEVAAPPAPPEPTPPQSAEPAEPVHEAPPRPRGG